MGKSQKSKKKNYVAPVMQAVEPVLVITFPQTTSPGMIRLLLMGERILRQDPQFDRLSVLPAPTLHYRKVA